MADPFTTLRLDPHSEVSYVGQIRRQVALLVADGRVESGTKLPAVRYMADQLDVNVNTVRAAYAKLQEDGLVVTRHGVGTTVTGTDARGLGAFNPGGYSRNNIGVIIAGLDPFYLPLVSGIEIRADEEGVLVLIVDGQDDPERARSAIQQLVARGVDGIICVSSGGLDPGERLEGAPPIVYVDQPDRLQSGFVFDAKRGGVLAAQHLVGHGHTRVGCLIPSLEMGNMRQLHEGYAAGLGEAYDEDLIVEVGTFGLDAGKEGLSVLLEKKDAPTAIVTGSAVLAMGVLREARARQLDVPGDVALIGYGDIEAAAVSNPALTMVEVPAQESGKLAFEALLARFEGDASDAVVTLEVNLMVRESCGEHAS